MKAVIFKKFGSPDVLQLADVEKPAPKDNEALVKIIATSVTAEDPKMRGASHPWLLKLPTGLIYGFKKPRKPVLGIEFSGIVEAVGAKATKYKINDRVFGYTGLNFGAYAEYKCIPDSGLMYHKPQNLSFEHAATIVNGPLSALAYLKKKGKIKKGDKILIYGASGSVGIAAVQLARYFEAEITAVCSAKNMELVRSLGADHVIDYAKEDLRKANDGYDIIFDTVGKTSMKNCMRLLKPKGRYLLTDFGFTHLLTMLVTSLFWGKKVICIASNFYWKREDLIFLKDLVENEKFQPVIDRSFSLEDIAEAHRYVETGHKVGNVAVLVQKDDRTDR